MDTWLKSQYEEGLWSGRTWWMAALGTREAAVSSGVPQCPSLKSFLLGLIQLSWERLELPCTVLRGEEDKSIRTSGCYKWTNTLTTSHPGSASSSHLLTQSSDKTALLNELPVSGLGDVVGWSKTGLFSVSIFSVSLFFSLSMYFAWKT